MLDKISCCVEQCYSVNRSLMNKENCFKCLEDEHMWVVNLNRAEEERKEAAVIEGFPEKMQVACTMKGFQFVMITRNF